MKLDNYSKVVLVFAVAIIFSVLAIQSYSFMRAQDIYEEKNQYCVSLGQNITSSPDLEDSFIESCECHYKNIIDKDMRAKCVCECYTDGTVCPHTKNGRCYITVMLTDVNDLQQNE